MDVSCLISKFESLGKKVDNLNTSVNNLRAPATAAQIATQLHALQKEDARKAAADAEKKKVEQSIRAATVKEIATKYDFIIECRHNGAFLVCKCCQSHSTRGTPGGTAGPPGEINTTNVRLYDVKRRVLSHMGTKTHLEALPRYKKHQNRTSLLEAYGYRISRTAYNTILEGRSYESFERDLLLQSLNGVDLGNFNHSNDFCRTFLSHLHTELKTLVVAGINDPQDVLGGRKPPFALNADKATMLHRTGHIVGLLIIDEGAIKAVLISDDVVPAKESDGENLAKAIIAALEPFLSGDHKAELKSRCTGYAFDGQYFGLNVPEAICAELKVKKEWVCFQWDGAHKLELTIGDVRQDKTGTKTLHPVDWYAPTILTVSQIIDWISTGQGRELFIAKAKELSMAFYSPDRFCETRFASFHLS